MRQRKILLPLCAPVGCESSLLSSRSCVHVGSPQLIPINLAVSSDLLDCEIFNLTIFNAWQSGPDDLFEPTSVLCFVDSLSKKKIRIKALLLDEIAPSLTRESCEALHQSIQEVVKYVVN
ncbi:hypothetical protein QYE76_036257 [Lolium multiflorum]|uniref:Uncharacterized protein n=1 Tax=Lolium multiflorum TaxID=4521 RepID=A0AAD8R431_LOLMU|nr:hypothetical protein QYE76_036257 [Lolium multiflorum]